MTGLRSLNLTVAAAAGLALWAEWHLAAAAPPAAKKPAASPTVAAIEKAAALQKDGKPEEALDVLRVVCRDVKKRRGEGHPDLLPIYDAAGEILVETDPREKAESLYEKSIAIRDRLCDEGRLTDQTPLGRTWFLLARVRLAAGKVQPALDATAQAIRLLDAARGPAHEETVAAWDLLDRVVTTCSELLGPDDPETLAVRERCSALNESFGRYTAAIDSRKMTLKALQRGRGRDESAAAAERERLQRLLLDSGRAADAIAAQEELVNAESDSDRGQVGPESTAERIEALRLLGELHLAAERFTAATEAFERALSESEKTHGKQHPEARLDRLSILAVETRRGRGPDAALVAETLAGPEEEVGSRPLVRGLAAAAAVLLEAGDAKAARAFAVRAIETEGAWEEMPAAARQGLRLLLARCLLAMRSVEDARGVIDEAVAESTSQLGPGAATTSLLLLARAECEAAEGDREAAASTLRAVLARGLPRRDFNTDQEVARVIAATAPAGAGRGDDGKAESPRSLWDDFVAMRSTQFGGKHRIAALARLLAGGMLLATGEPKAAREFLGPSVAALEADLGDDHPDVAAGLLLAGIAERDAGDPAAAERQLEKALVIWEKVGGPGNDATVATTHALAMTKVADERAADAVPLLERLRSLYETGGSNDDWRLAEVLVPLAKAYLAKSDNDRALDAAVVAAKLDCWQPRRGVAAADLEHRALTLADLANILRVVGENEAGTDAQRRARGLATRLENPRRVLTEVDRRATADN